MATLTLLVARNEPRSGDVYERRIHRLEVADDQTDRVVHLDGVLKVSRLTGARANVGGDCCFR